MKRILLPTLCLAALSAAGGGWPTAALGSPLALVETLEPPAGGDALPGPPAVPDVPPTAPPAATAVAPEPPVTPDINSASASHREMVLARRQAARATREAETTQVDAEHQYADRLQSIIKRGPGSEGRSLVIRASETDSKSLAQSEEDLAVMARILNKSLAKKGGDEHQQVMGVMLLSGGDGVRNLLIEGYGAIFMLRANIPLIGAPAKADEEKPPAPANSTWDEAKQELYGTPRHTTFAHNLRKIEFDPKRVEDLKDSLLEAMKNASNIRSLKENEYVTVVVNAGNEGNAFSLGSSGGGLGTMAFGFGGGGQGGGGGGGAGGGSGSTSEPVEVHVPGQVGVAVASGGSGFGGGRVAIYGGGLEDGHAKSATLTIRARKSDIDSFFKGKLNLEEFRKKASIAIY